MLGELMNGPHPAAASVVELSASVPALDARDGKPAWLLVRLFTEPLGMVVLDVPESGRTAEEVVGRIIAELGTAVQERLSPAELSSPASPPRYPGLPCRVLASAPDTTLLYAGPP